MILTATRVFYSFTHTHTHTQAHKYSEARGSLFMLNLRVLLASSTHSLRAQCLCRDGRDCPVIVAFYSLAPVLVWLGFSLGLINRNIKSHNTSWFLLGWLGHMTVSSWLLYVGINKYETSQQITIYGAPPRPRIQNQLITFTVVFLYSFCLFFCIE